jgi:hypothetical protein
MQRETKTHKTQTKQQEIQRKKKNKKKIKTSEKATQNPTTSSDGGSVGGEAAEGGYCLGRGEHAPVREFHIEARVVQKAKHKEVVES